MNPKTSEKTPPKTQHSESGDVSCSVWIYCCFLGLFFGGGVALGRQEKVKFFTLLFICCPVLLFLPLKDPIWMGMVGVWEWHGTLCRVQGLWGSHTWRWRGTGSRKVLVGFAIIGVVLSFLGFLPLFLSSQISTVKAPKAVCKAQALPEGPREHQPTWKQQRMSRTQKRSQNLTQST